MKKKTTYLGLFVMILGVIIASGPMAGNTEIALDKSLDETFVNVNIEFLTSEAPLSTKWIVTVDDNPPDTFSVFKGYLLDYGGASMQWIPGDSTKNGSVDILFPREVAKYFKK
jgi:hypothetical protein